MVRPPPFIATPSQVRRPGRSCRSLVMDRWFSLRGRIDWSRTGSRCSWPLIILGYLSAGLSGSAATDSKMAFWLEPKKGANFFNDNPAGDAYEAAAAAGIDWVRLAYDKWPAVQRDFLIGDAAT